MLILTTEYTFHYYSVNQTFIALYHMWSLIFIDRNYFLTFVILKYLSNKITCISV